MAQANQNQNANANAQNNDAVEPYKLSEIFSLVPEYDGDQISLNTFINACNRALQMCTNDQQILLAIKIKNQLRGKAAQLINSRDLNTWDEISQLLTVHFGDPRDLTSLIQDLQRMFQLPNENPLTFAARLQTHNAKMYSAVAKQILTQAQKNAQILLIDNMCLNTLLTGLEPRLGQIIRANNPVTMLDAINRVKRELQLHYFENQKFQKQNKPIQKPNQNQKFCSYCKRNGHTVTECRSRPSQTQIQRQNVPQFRTQNNPQQFQRTQNFSQNFQRPANMPTQNRTNQNIQRPQQSNTFYHPPLQPSTSQFNQRTQFVSAPQQSNRSLIPQRQNLNSKTFHLNQDENTNDYMPQHEENVENSNFENSNFENTEFDNPDYDQPDFDNSNYDYNNQYDYCPNNEHYSQYNNFSQNNEQQNFSQCNVNFPNEASEISQITAQFQEMNTQDNFDPNLNFSEQIFI